MSRAALIFVLAAVAMLAGAPGGGARAASCGRGGDGFDAWLAAFREQAAAQGVSRRTLSAALDGIGYSRDIVARDRRQSVFAQSFLQFSDRMVAQYRLDQGRQRLGKYASTFARIEKQFGVPAPVIVAFWGLETDFGANIGNLPTVVSLATLAWDCRRPDMFRAELMAALKIIDRGDLAPDEMIGPWAGELGQTQFLPTHYHNFAVDYDGDGRRDLLRSIPDVLASSANMLKNQGWRAGEPWLEEVRVPRSMPWDQADIDIRLPRSQWARWGVRAGDGSALKADGVNAALLLPMGRDGPAFLAYRNFDVYLQWNQSLVYATTAAYFATRLAGAPRVGRGNGEVVPLSLAETKTLQQRLAQNGFDVGKADGIIGAQTRAAVKAMQIRLGLPADSYPSAELLDRLR